MIVRGAGAIGATGAAGMAQAFLEAPDDDSFQEYIDTAAHTLRNTRPTAQNLFYGIQKVFRQHKEHPIVHKRDKKLFLQHKV